MSNSFFSERLNYAGVADFVDGSASELDYAYNANGALTRDLNKGISIEYDLLGNPKTVTLSGNRYIEYVYAADGRRLKMRHVTKRSIRLPGSNPLNPSPSSVIYVVTGDSTDYQGNLLLKNGKAGMYQFQGGYYSFNSNGVLDGCHYYIQDYQGNNRMVVNKNGTIEQITHYYPYGELMADISTNPTKQEFKYSGKGLDRTYGLDLYDYHARQQDPKLGCFTSIDPLAEKYYRISPYAYCAGDPVNCIDPDGRKIVVLGSKIFKDNYNYAVTYLKSIGAGAIIERLEKDPNFTITVTMATGKTPSEYKNGKLRWNPSQGVLTDNNYILSPAEVLNHEADHGLDDKTNPHHTENSQTDTNNQYDSKEEERVITGSEQDTAEKTGKKVPIGGTRTNHNGTPVEVENCISSKPNL